MKKVLLLFTSIFIITNAKSQIIFDGYSLDSLVMSFDTMQTEDFVTDSSNLWQIGQTTKPFFSVGSSAARSMMTDTVNNYPTNANGWFQIAFPGGYSNVIINFIHKYQTDSFHDGCIVEFSTDTGATWENVKGDCNVDGTTPWNGILTENLYSNTDTLITGEMAFSGTSNEWIHSRVQFFWGLPIKSTDSTNQCNMSSDMFYLRFRFVSDSTADTLDGWIFESIKIEYDGYSGIASIGNKKKLEVYPNPSVDGQFYFPELTNDKIKMEIVNSLGQTIYKNNYQRNIDLSRQAKGLYFYRVLWENEQYSGQLIVD